MCILSKGMKSDSLPHFNVVMRISSTRLVLSGRTEKLEFVPLSKQFWGPTTKCHGHKMAFKTARETSRAVQKATSHV